MYCYLFYSYNVKLTFKKKIIRIYKGKRVIYIILKSFNAFLPTFNKILNANQFSTAQKKKKPESNKNENIKMANTK